MPPAHTTIDRNKVYLDPTFLDRERIRAGKGAKDYADDVGIDYRTLRDILDGGGVIPSTAKEVADRFRKDVLELLAPWDPRYEPQPGTVNSWLPLADWKPKGVLEPGRAASNGLYYIVCKMQHQHTVGKEGRGKQYHLFWLQQKARTDIHHQLTRHADTCARVGIHPNVAVNLTSTPVANGEGWWVIDDWVGEKSLAEHLRAAPWPTEHLPRLLLEIALGLDALHRADVVFRELAPSRILISEKDGRAVLTDFELAKLLDGSPSVSDEWPEDPFRAPEVDGGTTTVQADLYSLAQVAAASVAGKEFQVARTVEILKTAGMPKRLHRLIVDCSEPIPNNRPDDLSSVIAELARWAKR
jgi:serine/threonine protein kinase